MERIRMDYILYGGIALFVGMFVSGVGMVYITRLVILAILTGGGAVLFLEVKKQYFTEPEPPKPEPVKIPQPIVFQMTGDSLAVNTAEIYKACGFDAMLNQYQAAPQQTAGLNTGAGYMQPVIPTIKDSLVLVLLGSQGTGKTTLLCHLIDARPDGKPIIIDPHGYPGKYNGHEIVGAGRNYPACDECMQMLMDEINRRYQDYYRRDYEKLYVYIDEATLLKKNCGSFQAFMEIMLTESRKVNIRLTLCLHSRRAKFLGLQGAMDLAEGIDWLNLYHEAGQYWCELETPDGNVRLASPGPYHPGSSPQNHRQDDRWFCNRKPEAPVYQAGPGPHNQEIITMHRIGYNDRPDMGTDQLQTVYDCLYRSGRAMSVYEIIQQTGLSENYLRKTLARMVNDGVLSRPGRGMYEIVV